MEKEDGLRRKCHCFHHHQPHVYPDIRCFCESWEVSHDQFRDRVWSKGRYAPEHLTIPNHMSCVAFDTAHPSLEQTPVDVLRPEASPRSCTRDRWFYGGGGTLPPWPWHPSRKQSTNPALLSHHHHEYTDSTSAPSAYLACSRPAVFETHDSYSVTGELLAGDKRGNITHGIVLIDRFKRRWTKFIFFFICFMAAGRRSKWPGRKYNANYH